MKDNIKQYWWVTIIVLILGGAFYWFQWRPAQMRIECGRLHPEWAPESWYLDCLHERGVDK